ncbi:MAG: carboxypeptidase-like regulatory domain-containing protein, partial [Elusimicrobiota bacterium]
AAPDAGNDAAGLGITWTSNGSWIDRIGWKTAGQNPDLSEGDAIEQVAGLQDNEQYVRKTSTSGVDNNLGKAYDSGDNDTDFVVSEPLTYPPRNSFTVGFVVSGTPCPGAIVSANDGLSTPTTAYAAGDPPYAQFRLTSIATGTWVLLFSSGTHYADVDNVAITANSTTPVVNSATDPVALVSGHSSVLLSSYSTQGFISGRVTDAAGGVISPAITIYAGGSSVAAESNGSYILSLSSATYTVTANPNNAVSAYVAQDQANVAVTAGQLTSGVDFTLSQGGIIHGFITRDGTNALPGIGVAALDVNGLARAQTQSDVNGRFQLVNLATGTYSIEPALDSGETADPASITDTVTAGASVHCGTFTISNAFGSITGTVQKSGAAIQTGVLILASTATISTPPPALSNSSLTGAAYYMNSSREDGTYSIDVRGSTQTAYRVYAHYVTYTEQTPVIHSSATSNVWVTAGTPTTGINFSWP